MKKLIFIDPNIGVYQAFSEAFAPYKEVEVVKGYFQYLPVFDCIVSAANSFGMMDGGVDYAIRDFFGYELQRRVQQRILSDFRGEQPVGTSMIVETQHPKHPFIAHTPTMRVPMPITRTDNVYKAMFAMLLAVEKHNSAHTQKIETIACPGLGTSAGSVSPKEAARQMELAYRHFQNPPKVLNWDVASQRQQDVIWGGDLFV